MGRLISGLILGCFIGAVAILALAGQSDEPVSLGHLRLPIRLEFEFGDAERPSAPAALAMPGSSGTAIVSDQWRPEFQAIHEQRQVCGSGLAGTTLVEGVPPAQLMREFEAGLCKESLHSARSICIASSEPECPASNSFEIVSSAPVSTPENTSSAPLMASAVREQLEATATKLYALAAAYEEQSYYERADEVRSLARSLRNQSQFIAGEVAISPAVETAARPIATPEPPLANPPTLPAASPVVEAPSDPTNPDS